MSDAYHTCYVLAGLSSAQHTWTYYSTPRRIPNFQPSLSSSREGALTAPYDWVVTTSNVESGEQVFDEVDHVGTLHPVFVVPEGVAERTRDYFEAQGGF